MRAMKVMLAMGLATIGTAQAHHSYSMFDRTTDYAISGHITKVEWINPHVILRVKTHESQDYIVEWQSVGLLGKAGLHKDNFAVGDEIVLHGARARAPNILMMSLIREVSLPAKNWRWQQRSRVDAASVPPKAE